MAKKTRRQRRYKMYIVIEEEAQPWFAPTGKTLSLSSPRLAKNAFF